MKTMKCLLIYYSGTNNTTFLTNKLSERLEKEGIEVEKYRINPLNLETLNLSKYDLIGIGYPIYGFNLPGIVHKFFKKQKWLDKSSIWLAELWTNPSRQARCRQTSGLPNSS